MQSRVPVSLAVFAAAALLAGCESVEPLKPIAFADRARMVLVPGDPGVDTVMKGLNNPRGLAFSASGALYVAEAGRGSSVAG